MTLATSTSIEGFNPTIEDRVRRVDELDMGPIKWVLVTPQYGAPSTMTNEEADTAIAQYRMTLKLWLTDPSAGVIVSRFVDEVWHAHIGDTTKYTTDMDYVFGRYIHHYPYFGVQGLEAESRLIEAFQATAMLFRERFGVDIVGPSIAWADRHHRTMAKYFRDNPEPLVGDYDPLDITARCCNACGKCSDAGVADPAVAALMFGDRPRVD